MLNPQRLLLALGCLLCFVLLKHFWDNGSLGGPQTGLPRVLDDVRTHKTPTQDHRGVEETVTSTPTPSPSPSPSDASRIQCPDWPGADDIAIILKTGSTEIYEKLPVHFATTFACMADYLVYSDVQQEFGQTHVRDALALVTPELKDVSEELAQYRVLQQHVKIGGDAAELKGEKSWKLDKWKFLPMIRDAYMTFGERKKWYLFIEADTYVSFHNLFLWLQKLNPSRPIFAGAQVMIGSTEFAHGGSGFILSAPAAKALADEYIGRQSYWEQHMANDCCGDKVMAEVLLDATPRVHILRSFPLVQGETLTSLDWSPIHWCKPAVTWHHVDPAGIDRLWQFERDWRVSHGTQDPMLFRDYYETFVHPRIAAANWSMRGWDNLSNDWVYEESKGPHDSYESAETCERFCREEEPSCLQWAWRPGSCRGGRKVRLGWALGNRPALGSADDRVVNTDGAGNADAVSGWVEAKIEAFKARYEPCDRLHQWITKNNG